MKKNIFKEKNEDYNKIILAKTKVLKKIVLSELENKTLKFKISSNQINRFDEINWDWNISIKQNQDYTSLYSILYKEQESLLDKYINEEKKLLEAKIKDFDNYYIKKSIENEKFTEMFSKFSETKEKKKFITKENLLINLTNTLDYLNWKKHKKHLLSNHINFDLLSYWYHHPIFWTTFDIKLYLEKKDKYEYYFYKELYWKKINKSNNLDSYIESMNNCNTVKDNGYLFLNRNFIDVINEKKELIKLKKLKNINIDENEEKELNLAIEYFKTASKTPYFAPNKKENNFYYIQDNKIKTLANSLIFNISDYFNILDKYEQLLKWEIYIDVQYLNYNYWT